MACAVVVPGDMIAGLLGPTNLSPLPFPFPARTGPPGRRLVALMARHKSCLTLMCRTLSNWQLGLFEAFLSDVDLWRC